MMSELNGFFSLRTPQDLRQKLEVDFNRLCAADQSSIEAQYAAFDFFVCAEHLPDWLSVAVGGSKTQHRSYPNGALVSHIANGAKHFKVRDVDIQLLKTQHSRVEHFKAMHFSVQHSKYHDSLLSLRTKSIGSSLSP